MRADAAAVPSFSNEEAARKAHWPRAAVRLAWRVFTLVTAGAPPPVFGGTCRHPSAPVQRVSLGHSTLSLKYVTLYIHFSKDTYLDLGIETNY